jgi:hypothetical protein
VEFLQEIVSVFDTNIMIEIVYSSRGLVVPCSAEVGYQRFRGPCYLIFILMMEANPEDLDLKDNFDHNIGDILS